MCKRLFRRDKYFPEILTGIVESEEDIFAVDAYQRNYYYLSVSLFEIKIVYMYKKIKRLGFKSQLSHKCLTIEFKR